MIQTVHIAIREIKLGFRNPWAYSFMGLFALFMLCLLMINAQGYVQGYSGITGTTLNLILYLLPLMSLLLGSFSLTAEKEDGSWELLSVYPLSTLSFIIGKYIGLAIVLLVIVSIGFGAAGILGYVAGSGFGLSTYVQLLTFSSTVALFFLAIAILLGTIAKNRWQSLTIAVAIWFFAIIGWPPLLIATLGFMPYPMIKPAVTLLTFLNPAELSRLFTVVKLGGGAILGPEYYEWIKWIRQPGGSFGFAAVVLVWIGSVIAAAQLVWERRRLRG
ncbi:ABC transporter permease [Paenibacillus sinopodophylli]|uniref:ABC transporter permease n=1 Tax=Paenibacillus sinopodophylli TaxID=1837342 RepID=UPI0014864486|nr:ABC transporter permease [Paenibacillus sinopodophylli]